MRSLIFIIIFVGQVLCVCTSLRGDDSDGQSVQVPDNDLIWDPFFVGSIEAWNTKIADYRRQIRSGKQISQDTDAIGAFFGRAAFAKFRADSEAGALVRTVKLIKTERDKESIDRMVKDSDIECDLAFVTTDALSLLPVIAQRIWPVEAVSIIRGAAKQTRSAEHIEKTRSSLSALLATGGRIDYEERLFQATNGARPWMIYRAIVYRAKVGDEVKSVPLFVNTMHVIEQGP